MHTQFWLLNLLVFISLCENISSQSSTTRSVQPVVYTAETARQLQTPYPATKSDIPSSTNEYNPNSRSSTLEVPEVDNVGFVDPADFNKFLSNVAYDTGSKKSSTFNPFTSESKSKDSFPDFFNSGKSRDDQYYEPFGSLSSSASNQNSRKPKGNDDGFVDPSVQFRSLFDSTETADGFQPEEFLNYNGESVGSDPSKGSQTQAYPSFTYTGRQGGEDDANDSPESSNPRYRSSYRQVNRDRDPYDDRNYYGGEYDNSPRAPSPPPRRYQVNNGNSRESGHAPSSQETSHSPQAPPEKQKGEAAQASKNKCKKVEKVVDDEEDYDSYVNPDDGGYDPSTYNSRYKRQAERRNQQKKKGRPMTCYVCEDEEGRYAERCSYDSNSDPKKGAYFHSSSTSYNDNGRKSKDRHRRNPKGSTLATSASGLFITSTNSSPNPVDENLQQPITKRLEKRQSQGNRYADRYRDPNAEIEKSPEHNYNDYEGPESYYGRNPSSNSDRERDEEEDGSDYAFSPSGPANRNPYRPNNNRNNRNNNHRDFDFGPPSDFGKDEGQDSPGFVLDYDPKEFEGHGHRDRASSHNRPVFSSDDFNKGFDVEYSDYIKKYFPDAFGDSNGGGSGRSHSPPPRPSRPTYHHQPAHSPPSNRSPVKESTQPAPFYRQGPEEEGPEYLEKALTNFGPKDRRDCQRVQKGDMTCVICKDRGRNMEECMYASNGNDPHNTALEYQKTEYSSFHPKVLPGTKTKQKKSEQTATKEVKDYDFDY